MLPPTVLHAPAPSSSLPLLPPSSHTASRTTSHLALHYRYLLLLVPPRAPPHAKLFECYFCLFQYLMKTIKERFRCNANLHPGLRQSYLNAQLNLLRRRNNLQIAINLENMPRWNENNRCKYLHPAHLAPCLGPAPCLAHSHSLL
jgi:hypothetical protein